MTYRPTLFLAWRLFPIEQWAVIVSIFHDVGQWSSGHGVEVHINPPETIRHFLRTFGGVLMVSGR